MSCLCGFESGINIERDAEHAEWCPAGVVFSVKYPDVFQEDMCQSGSFTEEMTYLGMDFEKSDFVLGSDFFGRNEYEE